MSAKRVAPWLMVLVGAVACERPSTDERPAVQRAGATVAPVPAASRLEHEENHPDVAGWGLAVVDRDGETYAFVGVQSYGLRIYKATRGRLDRVGDYPLGGVEIDDGHFSPGTENGVAVNATGTVAVLLRELHAQGAQVPESGLPCQAPSCVVGLEFVDVSDPATPKRASFMKYGHGPSNAAFAPDGMLYVTSTDAAVLDIIDARDPTRPVLVARWSADNRDFPYYDTRPDAGLPRLPEVGVPDPGRPDRPVRVRTCDTPESPDACFDGTKRATIFDRAFRPHDVAVGSVGGRRRLYIAARNKGAGAYIVDATDATALTEIGRARPDALADPEVLEEFRAHSAKPSPDGKWLVVSNQIPEYPRCPGGGLAVFDISNEAKPVPRGTYYADAIGTGAGAAIDNFCTAGYFEFLPGRNVVAAAWQAAGAWLVQVDVPTEETDPGLRRRAGRTLGHALLPGAHTSSTVPIWDGDELRVLAVDHNRGLDVLTYTGPVP